MMFSLIIALISGIVGSLILTLLPAKKDKIYKLFVVMFSLISALSTWYLAFKIFAGEIIRFSFKIGDLVWSIAPDPLGIVFALIASNLWLFTSIYSFGYMEGKENTQTYYTFLMLSLSMTLGVAFAGNLIALYLFYEFLTFATYPLVIHERTKEAIRSGRKYILYSLLGAGLILIAIIIFYSRVGNLGFSDRINLSGLSDNVLNWILLLFVMGFGVKAAIMPLHHWLPNAMVAPTPVSALLHAVAVVYSGVYGILRISYSLFGYELMSGLWFSKVFLFITLVTILLGIIIARKQELLKRRLAYQTISHLAYILLGLLSFHPLGLAGAIMHMISYSTLKITLFFCAGIISEKTGIVKVSDMDGIGWILPKTMVIFSIATLGMIGILPLNTFWGKFYLMKGSIATGQWFSAFVLVVSGFINGICFIPIIIKAFAKKKTDIVIVKDSRLKFMFIPSVILIIIALIIGIMPAIVWPGVQVVVNYFF